MGSGFLGFRVQGVGVVGVEGLGWVQGFWGLGFFGGFRVFGV